jgi:hypothetical protein
MQSIIVGRRAVLTKQGSPDIRVQVSAIGGVGAFEISENGRSRVVWPKYTPEQLKSGDTAPMTLDGEWKKLLDGYPDYKVARVVDCELEPKQ